MHLTTYRLLKDTGKQYLLHPDAPNHEALTDSLIVVGLEDLDRMGRIIMVCFRLNCPSRRLNSPSFSDA